jgi:hypothetical protein
VRVQITSVPLHPSAQESLPPTPSQCTGAKKPKGLYVCVQHTVNVHVSVKKVHILFELILNTMSHHPIM